MNVRRVTASTRHALAYLHGTRLSRVTARNRDLPLRLGLPHSNAESGLFGSLPLCQRVADRLADAMFAIFEALEMCEREQDRAAGRSTPRNADSRYLRSSERPHASHC